MSLHISDERLTHMRSVGCRAQLIAEQIGARDQESLQDIFLLGYLHDVGYEFADNQSDHARVGGEILRRNGYPYWQEVYYHGDPDADYSSQLLDILNTADMTTSPNGEYVTLDKRLEDIAGRYGSDSSQYIKARELAEQLVAKGLFV